jgi:hypothetical protein
MNDQATASNAGTGGVAHEFPAGRLSAFEDGDGTADVPDLSSILVRRARTNDTETADPADPASGDETGALAPSTRVETAEPATPDEDSERTASSDTQRAGGQRGKSSRTSRSGRRDAKSAPANRIRPSSVHIPVVLLDKIHEEKRRTGRSNGEIIIQAIEVSVDRLAELVGPHGPTGGALFAARASRGARQADGPLTALNVRLYEQDYEIIDKLVEEHGAFSRGHLITTALTAYFTDQGTGDR